MLMNEKIKATEVELTGLNGEPLGIMPTSEALAMAKKLKVDLVCTSLMSSPPPCKLIGAGDAKREKQQAKAAERGMKVKEIRLTPQIEEHDYETKLRQAEKTLKSGNAVLFVIRIKGKEGAAAKELLEQLITDLKEAGTKTSGIQLSGKQASVQLNPR
ncbi:translation initiation factor IF-3 [Paenibacillus sp. JTLBN-2024]|uniref:Translation initiation factor IF-3 n=1 Tax=Paenibacillus cookii TaxID=157839 RepID=A0ABQ4LQ68_9BACL|nr:translation initiation factor IF-3 [Paenibacillus cookii]KHF36790.1 Translation initiation factor IF-3 [Paenibacillus sp. P1XP2]GIO65390.1 translation initiation factor IF-3 [Paenibacillus cookii]